MVCIDLPQRISLLRHLALDTFPVKYNREVKIQHGDKDLLCRDNTPARPHSFDGLCKGI